MKDFFEIWKGLGSGTKGGIVAFALALLLAIFGFWKFLLIIAITIAGYYVGKRVFTDKEVLKNILDKILPPGKYR